MSAEKKVSKVIRGPRRCVNPIPDEIRNDRELKLAKETLPDNYNFEIEKTIWRIRSENAKLVVLQMPEGLYLFATAIVTILERFTNAEIVIMGEQTYGACCIDDYTAKALGADLLVHYGHSCLIPINQMFHDDLKLLYVFVNIDIDQLHCFETILLNFPEPKSQIIYMVSTIQFLPPLHSISQKLQEHGYETKLPQSKPLSPGEILGCTAPKIVDENAANMIVYIGDGRFHLEAMMMANPTVPAYKYDPYAKKFTREYFDFEQMRQNRQKAIESCFPPSEANTSATQAKKLKIGLILGTLGHQGNSRVLQKIMTAIEAKGHEHVNFLISELTHDIIEEFTDIDVYIQIACPRLSLDWGHFFTKPLLTTFEASLLLDNKPLPSDRLPMDFYAHSSFGEWTPNHKTQSISF